MSMEERRRKIMSENANWGAYPPSASQRSQITDSHPAFVTRAETGSSSLISNYDQRALQLNNFAQSGMHKTQLHDHYAHVHITTQGWSLEDLLRRSPNFREVPRVPQYSHRLADTIKEHEAAGTPLIIEKWEKHQNWEKASFTVEHFAENTDNIITVRNVHDWTDKSIPLTEFIHKSRNTVPFASSNESERLYGKDATCPNRWRKWLKGNTTLPPSLSPEGPEDLLRCRPKDESIETLMCYLGIGDTFTPCHKDLCASSGHNLMVYTEKDGSSYWFMTQSASAPVAEGYFNSLREVLDHETHVITVEQLAKAPFNIYIAEQKLGDLVLVPPRSCHQVVNAGGITIKASWSRMTFKGLETALYHELPLYRRVCRPETYRVKETTYHALIKLTEELGQALTNRHLQERESTTSTDTADAPLEGPNLDEKGFRKLLENIRCLIDLYRSILMEDFPNDPESLSSGATCDKQYCDFCGADIFQTYFICQANCHSPAGDCIICSGCYVEGRSCKCENMEPMQCRPFSELLYVHEQAVTAYNAAVNRGVCAEMKTIRTGLPPGRHPRIFQAATILHGMRKQRRERARDTRVCSYPRGEPKHTVPSQSALFCKKCHAGKCFAHLLSDHRIHAVQALLLSSGNDEFKAYHESHRKGKEQFDEAVEHISNCQKKGAKPNDGNILLAHNALTFGTCKPIYPTHLKPGWYDMRTLIINYTPIVEDGSRNSSSLSVASASSRDISPVRNEPSRKSPHVNNLAYVSIPPAPYLIPRQQNQHVTAGNTALNSTPSETHVKPKRRKSASGSRHAVHFPPSNPPETVIVARDVATNPNPTEMQHSETSVSPPSRKRKRQEPIPAAKGDTVIVPQRHKSLEEALNGAGSINGRLPTESDEDVISRLKGSRTQSSLHLGAKKRLPKSFKLSKLKGSISARSNEVAKEDDAMEGISNDEHAPVNKISSFRRNLFGRKGSSKAPAPRTRQVATSHIDIADARPNGKRNSVGHGEFTQHLTEDMAQIRIESSHNDEAEDPVDLAMDLSPSHSDFVEGDSSMAFIPNPAHVPTRLRRQPHFPIVDQHREYDATEQPTLHGTGSLNSEQQNGPKDPPQRRPEEQPIPQMNTPENLPGSSQVNNDSMLHITPGQLLEITKSITQQTMEEVTQTFFRALGASNTAGGQVAREVPPQAPTTLGVEPGSGHAVASPAQSPTQSPDLKTTIKIALLEIVSELSGFGGVAPSNHMPTHPSATPNEENFARSREAFYSHMQMHGQRDDIAPYQRYDPHPPSASMAFRADERGEVNRYHHNDAYNHRPHTTPRNSYPSNKPPYYTQRPYNRPGRSTFNVQQNRYASSGGKLQRLQWDRQDERPSSPNKGTSSRYQPYDTQYENRRITRSSTRRLEARIDHSPDSIRESRYDHDYAGSRSPSSSETMHEKSAPEGRITRSAAAAATSHTMATREQRERSRARTPPGEPPLPPQPNRTANDEDRQNSRKASNNDRQNNRKASTDERQTNRKASNDERQNNRKAPMEARDPQDWEEEYDQDVRTYGETRSNEPANNEKSRSKRALQDELQRNPWT